MNLGDPFVEGLRRVFAEREDLTPAGVSKAAGLSTSTIRKILTGEGSSPKVSTALRICAEIGVPISEVIRIGAASQQGPGTSARSAASSSDLEIPEAEIIACGGRAGQIVELSTEHAPMQGDLLVISVRSEDGLTLHLGRYAPPFVVGVNFAREAAVLWRIGDKAVEMRGVVSGFVDPSQK
ncbi:MAG: helix-turn-helix transcriptional regulator [Pseudomonadota bacterium]